MGQGERGELTTLHLRARNGATVTLSALLIRDRFHIGINRIELLGTEHDARAAEALAGHGLVSWEYYVAPGQEPMRTGRGRGLLRSVAHFKGWHVAPNAVQIIGHIEVFETEDIWQPIGAMKGLSQTYWFLQRPHEWDRDFRRPWHDRLEYAGPWQRLGTLGLRFRMKSSPWREVDPRVANEEILLAIPTIEIGPLSGSPADFAENAAKLWSLLRVLIAFRFRQQVIGAAAFHNEPDQYRSHHRPMPITPKEEPSLGDELLFRNTVDQYLRHGVRALWPLAAHVEHLHVSVYSYATTFRQRTIEEKLVNGVEAIERLVTVLEEIAGLERDIIPRRKWRGIAKSLKEVVDTAIPEPEIASRVKRAMSSPVTLSLEERIRRLVERDPIPWGRDALLLRGVGALITFRNHIVHGRRVSDLNSLSIQVDRAQLLFERLFFALIGQPDLASYCYRRPLVDKWDDEQERGGVVADRHEERMRPL